MTAFVVNPDLLVAVHTVVRDTIDAEGSAARVVIQGTTTGGTPNTTLATIPLAYPCGSVNGTTGQLTLSGGTDDSPAESGQATDALIQDAAGTTWITLPCSAGSTPVNNTCVLDSLTITAGYPVQLVSATIG